MLVSRHKLTRISSFVKSLLETQIWLMLTKKTEKLERSFANKLRAFFSKMQKEILREYKKSGTIKFDKEKWDKEFLRIYREESGKHIRLGVDRANEEKDKLFKRGEFENMLEIYFGSHGIKLASSINETTLEKLKNVIRHSTIEGLSIQETSGLINDMFDNFKGARARTIARTEVARASNWAYLEQMRKAGFVMKKYITAQDELVCPVCRPLNGKVVSIDGNFSIEHRGVLFTSAYPPMHPNCRCTIVTVREERKADENEPIPFYTDEIGNGGKELKEKLMLDFEKLDNEKKQKFLNIVRKAKEMETVKVVRFKEGGGDFMGTFSGADGEVLINSNAKDSILHVYTHEVTHSLQYSKYKKKLRDFSVKWMEKFNKKALDNIQSKIEDLERRLRESQNDEYFEKILKKTLKDKEVLEGAIKKIKEADRLKLNETFLLWLYNDKDVYYEYMFTNWLEFGAEVVGGYFNPEYGKYYKEGKPLKEIFEELMEIIGA